MSMNNGSSDSQNFHQDQLVKNLKKSLERPHLSITGNVTCTNPKCRTRMVKSNANLEINSMTHRAVMITGKAKIFILGKSIVAECVCGTKYALDDAISME
mgnify:CR=1 FL=1